MNSHTTVLEMPDGAKQIYLEAIDGLVVAEERALVDVFTGLGCRVVQP